MNERTLSGFAILLGFLVVGEMVARALAWPIPGNVVGMALLLVALLLRVVKLEWVESAAEALLSRLGLFFVPAGVGVMAYVDTLRREWLPIVAAMVVSTIAVLAVTGRVEQAVGRRRARRGG